MLNAAYNDLAGITAKFNLNLLTRINRELDANFDLNELLSPGVLQFRTSPYRDASRQQAKRQKVRVAGRMIDFRAGETIHTENSYKYTLEAFGALARGSGWTPSAVWTDDKKYFSVQALVAQDE